MAIEQTNAATLDKTFDPAGIESKWYAHWEENGLFRPDRPDAPPFTIVNPPPNVTGSLHIGHALDNTLQDIVVRYERLRGKDALWVVGTDHAGIATQMVVERQMEERQDKRTNYTREQFVEKVWDWKHESGGTITRQLRRLGCSMDWSREQFTMDPHFTRAVVKVFVDLFDQRLLYRDKRLVNWDPKLKTAISDLEVETREVQGHFWHFRYPLADGVRLESGADHIVVATTRPETMLADMAVAVHPDDERYRSVIGKDILQPITGRRFRVVADEHADPELGSGAVKITPGHDFNDFEVGKRAGIAPGEMLNMFDAEARVVQTADGLIPERYLGLDRFVVRDMIVADMKVAGCLIPHMTRDKDGNETPLDAEPRTIQTPFGDRGGVVIEPWLTDQWYVDAATLAKPAIKAVRSGAIEIVPKTWEKTFFNWMENIQPWCVSRQLWWGHRIPAWYVLDRGSLALGKVYVAADDEAAVALAMKDHPGRHVLVCDSVAEFTEGNLDPRGEYTVLVRDGDVLDTWFSSALWPFATLGWPDLPYARKLPADGPEAVRLNGTKHPPAPLPDGITRHDFLQRHYPNDLLISGFDILFFWDARMAMQGLHFLGDVPWKRLYLHGLVRAADGQKMSKSKGNVVDPLGLIDKYGADALRFFMAAMESQGRDVKMDERRVEGYRNFATKLWNAARFCQANGIGASRSIAAPAATSAVNKWIIGEVTETLDALDRAMADLRFDAAANAIYHFVWDTFCDWYIELIKPVLGPPMPSATGPDSDAPPPTPTLPPERGRELADETREVAGWVLDQILVMLHPFMPFVTEELWSKLGDRADYPLITAKWPEPEAGVDADAKAEVEWLIRFISDVRTTKVALDAATKSMSIFVSRAAQPQFSWLEENILAIKRLTRASKISVRTSRGVHELQLAASSAEIDVETIISAEGEGEVQLVAEGIEGHMDFFGEVDLEAAKARLTKALEAASKEAKSLEGRLNNPAFVEKAKPEAVEKARADHAMHAAEAERLAAALARLG